MRQFVANEVVDDRSGGELRGRGAGGATWSAEASTTAPALAQGGRVLAAAATGFPF